MWGSNSLSPSARARKTGLTQYRILFLQMSIYVIVCIKCVPMWLGRVFPPIAGTEPRTRVGLAGTSCWNLTF